VRPAHLEPYARPCPPDLSTFLRGLHPAELVTFGLACRCGETALLAGVSFNWEVVDAGCGACGYELSIYDPKVHGRDGWRGRNDYERPSFEVTPVACRCRMFPVLLGVAVDYGAGARSDEDFVWLAIAGRCLSCGEVRLILDVDSV
jgi:hypothetical protein